MPQNYNITITGSTPNVTTPTDSTLTLSDNGQTSADPSDTITWKIGKNSGVGQIFAITNDVNNSTDVFGPPASNEPAPLGQGNSGSWRGTINSSIAPGSIENYTIVWYTDADPKAGPYYYDPRITINPKPSF
jgi:hypothetical protein